METQRDILEQIKIFENEKKATIFKKFWIINAVNLEITVEGIFSLSKRFDISKIILDGKIKLEEPVQRMPARESIGTAEMGLKVIKADKLWKMGITGDGVIVMNIDTGVDGYHPALFERWRGNDPGIPYSEAWFDPETGSTFPSDGDEREGHGTHTMGIITGLDPEYDDTIGVAFGAKWIAARTINTGNLQSYNVQAFQWAIDPDGNPETYYDVPVVINCSWQDRNVEDECDTQELLNPYYIPITALETVGVAVIFSAGNEGIDKSGNVRYFSITSPKNGIFSPVNIWATGAIDGYNPNYTIYPPSSRGPSICDGMTIKPEACAPGVNIRSSIRGGGYFSASGTSMAAAHISGAIALLRSAFPNKTGTELKNALLNTAIDLGVSGEDNDYGTGLIDVEAAYNYLGLLVEVDQKLENGTTNVGTIGRWINGSFDPRQTPPKNFSFAYESTEVLHGDTNVHFGQKYNRWNDIPEVENRHIFDIETGFPNKLTSNFKSTYGGITIKNILISAPGQDGGFLKFKDPWFIDIRDPEYGNIRYNRGFGAILHERSSPFYPNLNSSYNGNEYHGVFLRQNETFDPNLPIYSVRAQQNPVIPFHGQNITWYFQGWQGEEDEVRFKYPNEIQTEVVFKQAGAVINAVYKGHLASSVNNTTADNNQRKVVRNTPSSPNVYMVYEDNGEIYFTSSTNNGTTWSPEIRLSEGEGNNHFPSIAINEIPNLAVTWEQHDISDQRIWIIFKMHRSGQWESTKKYYNFQTMVFNNPATPVVASLGPTNYGAPDVQSWLFVWRNCQAQKLEYMKTNYEGDFYDYGQVPGSTGSGNASNPTIGSGIEFHLGYNKIYIAFNFWYYIRTVVLIWNGSSWNWGSTHDLYYASSGKPQASADGAHFVHFSWQAGYGSYINGTYLVHQKVNTANDTWSTVFTYYNSQGVKNVNTTGHFKNGSDPLENNGTTLYWQNNQNTIYARQNINGTWGSPVYLRGNTVYPNSARIASKNNIPYVSTSETSAPYLLSTAILNLGQLEEKLITSNTETGSEIEHYRAFHLLNDSLLFAFLEIGEFTLNGSKLINLSTLNSGFSGMMNLTSAAQFLKTASFQLSKTPAAVTYDFTGWIQNMAFLSPNSEPLKIKLCLYDKPKGKFIQCIDSLEIIEGNFYSFQRREIHFLPQLTSTQEVYLRIEIKNLDPRIRVPVKSIALDVERIEDNPSLFSQKTSSFSLDQINMEKPTRFALSQNFPNPFNPSTTISYDLPMDVNVRLDIFDVAGRKIRVLMNELKEAGTHQVIWNGQDDQGNSVASGVYVYRIQAGDFVQSKKLLFMK